MSRLKESMTAEPELERTLRTEPQPSVTELDETRMDLPGERLPPIGGGENALYVGIDLGTSRTSISTSHGARHMVLSYVGVCKDVIGHKRLGKGVLVGQAALDNRLALDLVRPLRGGVIDTSDARCIRAVRELLRHVISLCEPQPQQPIYAVIGAPARASIESRRRSYTLWSLWSPRR